MDDILSQQQQQCAKEVKNLLEGEGQTLFVNALVYDIVRNSKIEDALSIERQFRYLKSRHKPLKPAIDQLLGDEVRVSSLFDENEKPTRNVIEYYENVLRYMHFKEHVNPNADRLYFSPDERCIERSSHALNQRNFANFYNDVQALEKHSKLVAESQKTARGMLISSAVAFGVMVCTSILPQNSFVKNVRDVSTFISMSMASAAAMRAGFVLVESGLKHRDRLSLEAGINERIEQQVWLNVADEQKLLE